MSAIHTRRVLVVAVLSLIASVLVGPAADASTSGSLTEQFHRDTTARQFRRAYVTGGSRSVHLYANKGKYDQRTAYTKGGVLRVPLHGGRHAKGFAAWFLANDVATGTMSAKVKVSGGSGYGLAILAWTTGNDPRGGEDNFGEAVNGVDRPVIVAQHATLKRCWITRAHRRFCPTAKKVFTDISAHHWHTYSVTISRKRTTYRIDGRVIMSTKKSPAGPAIDAGYRKRLTIQTACLVRTCRPGVLKIASVSLRRS